MQSIDWSIHSLSHGMGASDARMQRGNGGGGGVEAATTSVIANYFLKSHGGAHTLQCACSFLSTFSGLSALLLLTSPLMSSLNKEGLAFTMLQRCLLFSMCKHVSGMLAAASIAAKAIPKIGLSQARGWMEQLVLDPVSQYVAYTSLILLWLPNKTRLDVCWWWTAAAKNYRALFSTLLLFPILIREIVSSLLVISDVLVLSSVSNSGAAWVTTILDVSQTAINAVMSLVVSPEVWRSADPAQRQAILAKLVSKVSLAAEVCVGALLSVDFLYTFFQLSFLTSTKRPPFLETVRRLLCARLYLHFLYVRRRKIKKLALQVRGGATELPFWVLKVVLDPMGSMGLPKSTNHNKDDPSTWTWLDYLWVALGIDS